jgi:ATP-dependent Clp protease ATP-binding subunit ClpA
LQVMDHGTLTDTNGRKVDFRNVVIVMTTNAGAERINRASIGFSIQDHTSDAMETIKKTFSPEFRNRLDAIVQFKPLSPEIILHVVDKFIIELESQLEDKHVSLEIEEAARHWLAEHGYDKLMGARPMARLLQEKVKKPLAEELLFGQLEKGGHVTVKVVNDDIVLHFEIEQSQEAVSL